MIRPPEYEWLHDGAFTDADGASVRPYDDVVLLDEIPIEGDDAGPYRIPAGTIGTVLFFQQEDDGVADLECYWPAGGFSFGFAQTRRLRLHQRGEDKYRKAEGSVG